jgi:polyisoprenoid-binding protein YceI
MKPAPRRLRCGAFKISLIVGYLQIFDNAARTKLASNHRRKCRELASRTLGWSEGKQFAEAPSYFHITNRIGAVMMRAFGTQPPRQGGAVRRSRSLGLEMLWRISVTAGSTILLCLLVMSSAWQRWVADASSERAIDAERSVLTVHVYKAGLFSSFGHDHEIRAPIQTGTFSEEKNTVQFVIDARTLRVRDADVSDKDRAEVQATMLGPTVLDSERFREIRFHSIEVNALGNNKWSVRGELTLHGQTRPVEAVVERQNDVYRGSAQLRQKDFGIRPVSVAGGSVKVKDEVRVEFEIAGK